MTRPFKTIRQRILNLRKELGLDFQNPDPYLKALILLEDPHYGKEHQGPLQDHEFTNEHIGNHLLRVSLYSELLALKFGLEDKEADLVRRASPMHDIGKSIIPDHILKKPSTLTLEEMEVMKTHAQMGYEILRDSKKEVTDIGAMIAFQHQEKYDGSGYPQGLKGEEIHIFSRITTVADVYDALSSERCYKPAWSIDEIIKFFQAARAIHFDPRLTDLFIQHSDEFVKIKTRFSPLQAD